MNALRRFILWDFARATWQYDLIVAIILAFIFLTPREWFRDQPRASSIAMLPADHNGAVAFWIEPELLSGVPRDQWAEQASNLLKAKTGKKQNVLRLEPIFDSEKDIKGYMAFTTQ